MIDMKKLNRLSPEQRQHYEALLAQHPHLSTKQDKREHKLDTPTKMELDPDNRLQYADMGEKVEDELDATSFDVPEAEPATIDRTQLPTVNVGEGANTVGSSFEQPSVDDEKPEPVKAPPKPSKPYFSPQGKQHPVLAKMRATLGSRSGQLPLDVSVGGMTYGLKALDRRSVAGATALAIASTENPAMYDTSLETSIIAFSIATLDRVPVVDVFQIPENDSDGKFITKTTRDVQAAEKMFLELQSSPNELIETLGIHYQQNFPVLTLLEGDKERYMCPVAGCQQFRIAEKSTDNYCPAHGAKMIGEGDLPNPS